MATLRTAEKDQNYLSLNENSIVWFAGTPEEHEEPGPLAQPLELLPENPKSWDSILKCSRRNSERFFRNIINFIFKFLKILVFIIFS